MELLLRRLKVLPSLLLHEVQRRCRPVEASLVPLYIILHYLALFVGLLSAFGSCRVQVSCVRIGMALYPSKHIHWLAKIDQ
jgi:hypothetical protein